MWWCRSGTRTYGISFHHGLSLCSRADCILNKTLSTSWTNRNEHKIISFTLNLLVLAKIKTKKDKEIERAELKKKTQRKGQLGMDGVKLVEDHLTVIQVILMGPVARRTSQYGII